MHRTEAALELVSLVVDEYDPAIAFFVDVLGFELTQDEPSLTNDGRVKRWVVVKPRGGRTGLLLARADGDVQSKIVGAQFAGRVGLFLRVDDFEATYQRMLAAGVRFASAPRTEPYGSVVVFHDFAGNKWDLLGPRPKTEPAAEGSTTPFTLVGRSSSHFTRVARMFAAELDVPCELHVVRDLLSVDAGDYGDNPALKIPSLQTAAGTWFGALAVTRALARSARAPKLVLWPEDLTSPLASNAQELVLHAMSTGVGLVMSKLGTTTDDATPAQRKMRASLEQTMAWLETNVDEALAMLPPRDLSFLEVSLFCLVEHLAFREVMDTAPFPALRAFCDRFAARASARATPYRFDV